MIFITNFNSAFRNDYTHAINQINQLEDSGLFILDEAFRLDANPTPINGMNALWCRNDKLPEHMKVFWDIVVRAYPIWY